MINGAFYIVSPKNLRKLRSFYSDDMVPLVIDAPEESIDIDTEWDWKLSETVLKSNAMLTPTGNK